VCHFYKGWTLDDIRKLTVEEWDAAVETMNYIKKQEAGKTNRGANRSKGRPK
jgi:hypothetical protein